MSGRTVDLRIYVDPGMAPRAAYAMDALKRSMKWDEEAFGREYDLDLFMIVAVRDFNFGAMENKGLNIFNSSLLLADPATATDMDFERIESVVAPRVFPQLDRRPDHLPRLVPALPEGGPDGLPRPELLGRHARPRRPADQGRQGAARPPVRRGPGPAGPPVRPSSYLKIDNFYTATIYEKGARSSAC
jgi:aminopeptidase N